jgi:Na+/melibiose symporter-like transporter
MMKEENNPAENTGEPINRRRKVPIRTKLLFASGTLQEATVTAGGIVTVLFYNQIHGVSPALVGTAFLIASIVDAFSDPLMGVLSDRFRSRWGRRHPFMFISALPIAIAFYFLYQPIGGLSETGYFAWLTGFLLLLRLGQTFYLIPHDALGAELTDDYTERSSVFGYNSVAQMILSMVLAMIIYYVIFPSTPGYENGLLNEAGYVILASMGAVTITFSVLLCTLGTMDQIPYLHKIDVSKKFLIKGYFQELAVLLRNRSYLSACFSLLTLYAGLGILGIVAVYAYVYVFEISSEQMVWSAAAKLPGVFAALPLLWLLSKWWDKKQIVIWSVLVTAVLISSPHILKMLNLFPANDSPYLLLALFGPLMLGYMVFPVSAIIIDSQLVDVADEHELNTGARAEGVIFSVRSFGNKATQGVGGFIAGFGLEYIGFPENAEVGSLTPEAINGLLFLNGPTYLAIYLLAIFFMMFYRIDKKRHAEILNELEARREAAPAIISE